VAIFSKNLYTVHLSSTLSRSKPYFPGAQPDPMGAPRDRFDGLAAS
jgi:hypothetical protein